MRRIVFMGLILAGAAFLPLSAQDEDSGSSTSGLSLNRNTVELFPNPASDFITLTLADSESQGVEIDIYNIIGNKLRIEVEELDKRQYKIPVKDLAPGYYLVVLKDSRSRYTRALKFQKR